MRYYVFDFDNNVVLFSSKWPSEIKEWVYNNQELIIDKNVRVIDNYAELVDIW